MAFTSRAIVSSDPRTEQQLTPSTSSLNVEREVRPRLIIVKRPSRHLLNHTNDPFMNAHDGSLKACDTPLRMSV